MSFETILSEDNKQLTQQRLQTLYPSGRQIDNLKKVKRKAAILIPLCRVNGQPSILFTLRSSRLKAHRGEVRSVKVTEYNINNIISYVEPHLYLKVQLVLKSVKSIPLIFSPLSAHGVKPYFHRM